MSKITIEKNLLDLLKEGISKVNDAELRRIVNDVLDESYDFMLWNSMKCNLEEMPKKLRERLVKHNLSYFTDSNLVFHDLTSTIENFFYKVAMSIIDGFLKNHTDDTEDDDSYDVEDNILFVKLMDIWGDSESLSDFEFDKEKDTLNLTTYNFLDLKIKVELQISRMKDKEYMCELLISKFKEVLL